jgi:hypothetical protein
MIRALAAWALAKQKGLALRSQEMTKQIEKLAFKLVQYKQTASTTTHVISSMQ